MDQRHRNAILFVPRLVTLFSHPEKSANLPRAAQGTVRPGVLGYGVLVKQPDEARLSQLTTTVSLAETSADANCP